jgi:DNA invertase Pin-like site-specific DNA recombinase
MTQQLDARKRAVLYLRVRQVGGRGDGVNVQLARQRAMCTRVAEQHGATVIHEYAAIGGTREVSVRSVVHVMLDHATEVKAEYVITSGFDRLFRGPADDDRELLQAIRRSGATLLYGDAWDMSAPMGPSHGVLAEAHNAILAGRPA